MSKAGPLSIQIREDEEWIRVYLSQGSDCREIAALSTELMHADDAVILTEWKVFWEMFLLRKTAEITGLPFDRIRTSLNLPNDRN